VDERAQRYVERGKLLFLLGDVSLAMDDFHKAAELDPSNVPAYADPLRYVVAHGYYDEARDLYRRAMRRGQLSDELKLYFSLWVNELALRQEREPDADASSHLEQFVGTGWVQALARYGRGQLQFEELIARANDRGERAEAYFYEGLKRWRLGDIEQAKKLMHKVLDTEMMGFFEYDMALAYLEWGDLPRNARPPLVHSSQAETVPR
jgi:tetratricopeptide (TPR) repeat protein